MHDDRRKRTRVPLACNVNIHVSGREIPVTSWNLSLRGMQCSSHPRLKVGDTCQVAFNVSSEVQFRIEAKIVRVTEAETGIYFVSMDENGFHHLKKLIQYNSDDPDKIETEIAKPSSIT